MCAYVWIGYYLIFITFKKEINDWTLGVNKYHG